MKNTGTRNTRTVTVYLDWHFKESAAQNVINQYLNKPRWEREQLNYTTRVRRRSEGIMKMRQQGKSLAEIANKYSISTERVRQIELREKRRAQARTAAAVDPYAVSSYELSPRLQNSLKNLRLTDMREVAALTPAQFLRGPNFGRKTFNELAAILEQLDLWPSAKEKEPSYAISTQHLTTRTYNCLKNNNFNDMREVAKLPDAELLRIPNFGKVCLAEVKYVLKQLNLSRNVS